MKKIARFEATVNCLMALLLSFMGIFVFTNVVLRYLFNSGIIWAEEFSRVLFIWLIFLGAIGALKDNNHLGFTSFVQKLPPNAKKACFLFSNLLMVVCLAILLQGSIEMTLLARYTLAPATGMPLSYMYAVGIISSIGMFLVICCRLYRAIFVKGAIDELVVLKESEEEVTLKKEH